MKARDVSHKVLKYDDPTCDIGVTDLECLHRRTKKMGLRGAGSGDAAGGDGDGGWGNDDVDESATGEYTALWVQFTLGRSA